MSITDYQAGVNDGMKVQQDYSVKIVNTAINSLSKQAVLHKANVMDIADIISLFETLKRSLQG